MSRNPTCLPGNARALTISASTLIVVGLLLGLIAAGDNILTVDERLTSWIQEWRSDFAESLYRIGDVIGGTWSAIIVFITLMSLALIARRRRFVIFLSLLGIARLIAIGLKPIFDSPRPVASGDRIRIFATYESNGYPSGHSMTIAMIVAALIVITWHLTKRRPTRWFVVLAGSPLVLLVGWSRVWGGAHWPSDVIGGWAFGIAFVMLSWLASGRFTAGDTAPQLQPE